VNSNRIHLIYCKNFCKCYAVSLSQQQQKRQKKSHSIIISSEKINIQAQSKVVVECVSLLHCNKVLYIICHQGAPNIRSIRDAKIDKYYSGDFLKITFI
jgi:hypothetical protein